AVNFVRETTNRLGITISADCNKQLARAHIDAGCMGVQDGQFLTPFLGSLRHWLLRVAGRMPKARIKGKLPISPRVPLPPVWQTPAARLPGLIRSVPIWITSGSPTNHPERGARQRLSGALL